jgi:hypothetical protein
MELSEQEKERIKQEREARAKTIDEILSEAEAVKEVYIEAINAKIRFKKLTIKELAELSKIEDPTQRAIKYVYLMWSKGDPSVTLEKVEKLPADVLIAIATALDKASSPFLQAKSQSFTQAEKPKQYTS